MTWIYDDAAHNTLAGGGAGSAVTAPGREERQKLEHGIILPAVFNKTLFWSSHAFKITHEIAPGLPQLDRNLWSTDFDLINRLDNDITVCKWQVFALEKNICACSLIYLENFCFCKSQFFLKMVLSLLQMFGNVELYDDCTFTMLAWCGYRQN